MISQRAELHVVSFSVRVYQALLSAYPTKFQEEYGSQMVQVFRDCCLRAARQEGTNGMARLWVFTLFDLIQSVISEHAHKEIEMKKEMKPEDIRMAGGAFIWGAVAFVLGMLSMAMGGAAYWGVSMILITFLSMPLLVVGVLALRNRYGHQVGGFGKNILLAGAVLGPLMTLIGLFGVGDPSQLRGFRLILLLMFLIGPSFLHACLALFGIVALYKRPLPRWNFAPVIAGLGYPVLNFAYITSSTRTGDWDGGASPVWFGVALAILLVAQGIALAALGYVLKSDVPEDTVVLA